MTGSGSESRTKRFLSLRSKVIAGITGLVLILIVGVLGMLGSSQIRSLENAADTMMELTVQTVAPELSSLLERDDGLAIRNVAEQLEQTSAVLYVAVYDSSGKEVHVTSGGFVEPVLNSEEYRQAFELDHYTDLETRDAEGREIITWIAPLKRFDRLMGVALIGFAKDAIRILMRSRRQNVILLGIAALIVGIVMATLFARNVVGPVERLKNAAVRIGSGEFGETVEIETADEIGALAETFNVMSIELKKREEEVRRSERLSAIGTTASVIAHEMKTPLTSIKTYMDMLSIKYEDPDFRVKFTGTVDEQITRLGKLIDDLLDYSRDTRLHPADLDLNLQLHQAVSFFRDMFVSHRVHACEDYRSEQIVKADPDKLEQVFFNLIKNGIEAQGEGGAIAAMTADDNGSVLAMIADAGGGVLDEVARNIFDPFVTTKSKGTGLGLAIARKIVVAHGGEIELYSPLGNVAEEYLEQARTIMGDYWPGNQQGSCFVVRLPAVT